MPTTRRRHSITETPPVAAAFDALRLELGEQRLDLTEIAVLGAKAKPQRVRRERSDIAWLRNRLAERIRTGDIPGDPEAAEEGRRIGRARP